MKQPLYLLENTPENTVLINNIKELLMNKEESNILLALQLLKAGGCPQEMLSLLAPFFLYHHLPSVRKNARSLFKKYAPKAFFDSINATKDKKYIMIDDQLNEFGNNEFVDKNTFANTALHIFGDGTRNYYDHSIKSAVKYCIKNNTQDPEIILRKLLNGTELNLINCYLGSLPKEIGNITEMTVLHLGDNNICFLADIPKEIANLKNLKRLTVNEDLIQKDALAFLQATFPIVFATQYIKKSKYSESTKKNSLWLLQKAEKCAPDFPLVQFGYAEFYLKIKDNEKASHYFLECAKMPIEALKATNWEEVVHRLCGLKLYTECVSAVAKGRIKLKNEQQLGRVSNEKIIEYNFSFYEALYYFYFEDYEKSIEINKTALQKHQYTGGYFNIACDYSKLNDKPMMLKYLEDTFIRDNKYVGIVETNIGEADSDFTDYHEDADFLALVKKYKKTNE